MAEIRNLAVIAIYACLVAAFIAGNWLAGTQPNLVGWPDAVWVAGTSATRAGLDHDRLARSVQRLPSIRFLRMLGNNVRILFGQRLEWIIYGEQEGVPVLAPKADLRLSLGLEDQGIKANLDQLIKRLEQYSQKLRSEGWDLYIVPVPTKLSIYREAFPWPLYDGDSISRLTVNSDRSDDLFRYLGHELAARDVRFVDLQTIFREYQLNHPTQWLYPPGESHWSAHGIDLAAQVTAPRIAEASNLIYIGRPTARPMPYEHVGDMVRSMDAFPKLLVHYRSIYYFKEDLTLWPRYDPQFGIPAPDATLVAVLGTSFTGHYGWLIDQPVGFAQALGAHLNHAKIYQISQTGIGGFHPFRSFLNRKEELISDFARLTGQSENMIRKIVVWEFPIRDFGYLTAHSEATILHLDNLYGLEKHLERQLFWLGPTPATMTVFASEDGVIEFSADLQPGPARRPGANCTLVITNEAGDEFRHHVLPGPNRIRIHVQAGTNRLSWRSLEPAEILPPYANGDPRTLLLRVFDLKLNYEPGADPHSAMCPFN